MDEEATLWNKGPEMRCRWHDLHISRCEANAVIEEGVVKNGGVKTLGGLRRRVLRVAE